MNLDLNKTKKFLKEISNKNDEAESYIKNDIERINRKIDEISSTKFLEDNINKEKNLREKSRKFVNRCITYKKAPGNEKGFLKEDRNSRSNLKKNESKNFYKFN